MVLRQSIFSPRWLCQLAELANLGKQKSSYCWTFIPSFTKINGMNCGFLQRNNRTIFSRAIDKCCTLSWDSGRIFEDSYCFGGLFECLLVHARWWSSTSKSAVFDFLNEHSSELVIALDYDMHTESGMTWPPYLLDLMPVTFFFGSIWKIWCTTKLCKQLQSWSSTSVLRVR